MSWAFRLFGLAGQEKAVNVKIENPDNSLVESGSALQEDNGPDWFYTTTVNNTEITGDKITISASDLSEYLTIKETTLT